MILELFKLKGAPTAPFFLQKKECRYLGLMAYGLSIKSKYYVLGVKYGFYRYQRKRVGCF